MEEGEAYLGDGLYVRFDGWQVWLRAPRDDGDHLVAIEPQVMADLVAFVAGLRARFPDRPVPVWEALLASVLKATGPA